MYWHVIDFVVEKRSRGDLVAYTQRTMDRLGGEGGRLRDSEWMRTTTHLRCLLTDTPDSHRGFGGLCILRTLSGDSRTGE